MKILERTFGPQSERWLVHFFETIDEMNAKSFADFFSVDGAFQFANYPEARGAQQIEAVANTVFSKISKISHRIKTSWKEGQTGSLFVEGQVYYLMKTTKELSFPFFCIIEFDSGEQVSNYRAFIDAHELFREDGPL